MTEWITNRNSGCGGFKPICNYCEKVIKSTEEKKVCFHQPFDGFVGVFHTNCYSKALAEHLGFTTRKYDSLNK